MLRMSDVDLKGRRVLIRQDLNAPVRDGAVSNDARIRASLPTIKQALASDASVLLMSHLGRPAEGRVDPAFSLAPIANRLSELLGRPVPLHRDWLSGVELEPGEVGLGENVRFNLGETANDDGLAKQMAALCDVFVMDAFGTAHRAQASTQGVARFAPIACAGPLLSNELDALGQALENPARPLLALVGGAKVSTKLTALERLAEQVDQIIVGGGIANTFIAAAGYPVGASLYEPDLVAKALELANRVAARGGHIPVPEDVVVSRELSATATATVKPTSAISQSDMVLDIGPKTTERLTRLIGTANTIVWNGPVGVFEHDQFGQGTAAIARAIAESEAFSIAGGGETLAAIDKYGITKQISYVSTGGGAFLEFLEGKKLPAVEVLEQRSF